MAMTDKDSIEKVIAEAVITLRRCVGGLMHIPSQHLELFPYIPEIEELADRLAAIQAQGGGVDAEPRMFPIMGWRPIPWSVLEPREDWAQRNHSQSLFTLAQRGGLSPSEAVAVIEGRRWHRMDKAEAEKRLAELTAAAHPAAAKEPGVTEAMYEAAHAAYDSTGPHSVSLRAALTAALAQQQGKGQEGE